VVGVQAMVFDYVAIKDLVRVSLTCSDLRHMVQRLVAKRDFVIDRKLADWQYVFWRRPLTRNAILVETLLLACCSRKKAERVTKGNVFERDAPGGMFRYTIPQELSATSGFSLAQFYAERSPTSHEYDMLPNRVARTWEIGGSDSTIRERWGVGRCKTMLDSDDVCCPPHCVSFARVALCG
jgi:hypothetical protein